MRQVILVLVFFGSNVLVAQDYRMQASIGFHSTMFVGTKSFSNVTRKVDESFMYYEEEYYNIDYKNFSSSMGLSVKLAFNWINSEKYILRQSATIFADIYEQKLNYELTDFVVGDTSFFANLMFDHNFQKGDVSVASLNGLGIGAIQDLMFLTKLKVGWNTGGGISFNWMNRNDASFRYPNDFKKYAPNYTRLYFGKYSTMQFGVLAHVEKSFSRLSIYINVNQTFLTAKSHYKKGGAYFGDGQLMYPISHNLDFRFPTYIQLGCSINFIKIKR